MVMYPPVHSSRVLRNALAPTHPTRILPISRSRHYHDLGNQSNLRHGLGRKRVVPKLEPQMLVDRDKGLPSVYRLAKASEVVVTGDGHGYPVRSEVVRALLARACVACR